MRDRGTIDISNMERNKRASLSFSGGGAGGKRREGGRRGGVKSIWFGH